MKLVIYTQYDDSCNFWHEKYVSEYSSAEKFLCDFEDWCSAVKNILTEVLKDFLVWIYIQNI